MAKRLLRLILGGVFFLITVLISAYALVLVLFSPQEKEYVHETFPVFEAISNFLDIETQQ